jgi:hypothetical protein
LPGDRNCFTTPSAVSVAGIGNDDMFLYIEDFLIVEKAILGAGIAVKT